MRAIDVQDLFAGFGNTPVLNGVNFWVDEGETTIIAGISGSGKTVLLKNIVGLLTPTGGKIFINGRDIAGFSPKNWNDIRREIGMVFQGNALFDSMPVWENIGFYLLEHTDLPVEEIRKKVTHSLGLVDLKGTEDLQVDELSGGMKKRVALARTLIFEPKTICYDEPTAGLDPLTAESIEELMLDIQKKLGTTALMVTHDRHLTFRVANRIGVLSEGKVVGFGTTSEIKESQNKTVRDFFRLRGLTTPKREV
ncbi:MAG: ATP-binding cassette domain-containing protein [Candidatus Omnitrophota bacterium]